MPGWTCRVQSVCSDRSNSVCSVTGQLSSLRSHLGGGAFYRAMLGDTELCCNVVLRFDGGRAFFALSVSRTIMKYKERVMKILVTSPTGKIGRRIVPEL